jgi:hypothetical protein
LPNLRVLATCCVRLELRSLPSTSVTRLQRYYEPLRHPRAPGLSVTGVRLVVPDHALGLPVLPALSLCTCCRHYPGAATGLVASLIHPVVSAFPGMAAGSACASTFSRLARRSLALRPAHSRCHQVVARFTRRLQPLRYLHDCSGCFRLERLPGGICTHWKSAALSRRTPPPAIHASEHSGRERPQSRWSSHSLRSQPQGGNFHSSRKGSATPASMTTCSNGRRLVVVVASPMPTIDPRQCRLRCQA